MHTIMRRSILFVIFCCVFYFLTGQVLFAGSDTLSSDDKPIVPTKQILREPSVSQTSSPRLVVQSAHGTRIVDVAFSPCGRVFATTGLGVRVCNTLSRRQIRLLNESPAAIKFRPRPDHGSIELAWANDREIAFYDVVVDKVFHRIPVQRGFAIKHIAINADGTIVAAVGISQGGGDDAKSSPELRIWTISTGQEIASFVGDEKYAGPIDFGTDPHKLIVGGRDGFVRLLDLKSRKAISEVETGDLTDLCAGAKADQFGTLSGTDAGLWSFSEGKQLKAFELPRRKTERFPRAVPGAGLPEENTRTFSHTVEISSNGKWIASGGTNTQVWRIEDGEPTHFFRVGSYCDSIAFSPDSRILLTGNGARRTGDPSNPKLWDLEKNEELPLATVSPGLIRDLQFSNDGTLLAVARGNDVSIWDLSKDVGTSTTYRHAEVNSLAFEPHNKFLASGGDNYVDPLRRLQLRDLISRSRLILSDDLKKPGFLELPSIITSVSFSSDGKQLAAGTKNRRSGPDYYVGIWDSSTAKQVRSVSVPEDCQISWVGFQPGGRLLSACGSDGTIRFWNATTFNPEFSIQVDGVLHDAAFFADGNRLACSADEGILIYNLDRRDLAPLRAPLPENAIALSIDVLRTGDRIVCGCADGKLRIVDAASAKIVSEIPGHDQSIQCVAIDNRAGRIASAGLDGRIRFWTVVGETLDRVGDILYVSVDDWIAVSGNGHFDTSNIESLRPTGWVFPDDPLETLSPEVFFRDYYEPRLLSRVLKGEKILPVRSLSSLNRVQPSVELKGITIGANSDETVVAIEVSAADGTFRRDGKSMVMRTDAYDFRLFRNGQLVGRWPEPRDDGEAEFNPDPTNTGEMQKWRDLNRVKADGQRVIADADGKMTFSIPVRLPSRPEPGPVEFTAYAFNEDRVKSETARFTYQAPAQPSTRKPRAYLVCVGVSACQTETWDLAFAANDAQAIAASLDRALRDRYDVVPVVLTSQYSEERTVASTAATKENLRAVLDLLAGKSVKPDTLKRLPHGGQLRTATPDDLVLVSFSGHGYTDTRGALHLIPYDVGSGQKSVTDAQSRCISSGELSAWLRGIDAGETVLVVDACHSAAAIAEPGFKPGPLGNRGLGQLAYDKGMRVLAAAQGDDVALESRKVKQGLLTYALVRDGLEQQQAAKHGKITLGGLLTYAAERVPSLYEEVVAGKVKDAAGETAKDVAGVQPKDPNKSRVQRPELFDYAKKRPDVSLTSFSLAE